ncbi:MAG: tetratricopeptide repeat protein [Myxococcaceae bacterium]
MGSMLPFGRAPLTDAERVESWREMIAECDRFYAAHIELGIHLLRTGSEDEGRAHLDRGLVDLLDLSEHTEEEVGALVENLERIWRYDVCRSLMERVVERWPGTARYHDALAHSAARTGDFTSATTSGLRALELEPNSSFLSNMGLYAMMAGRLDEAGSYLERALSEDRKNAQTRGNLEVLKYLRRHGGRYADYLVRPAQRDTLDKLADKDDLSALELSCGDLNDSRFEAFAQDALDRGEIVPVPETLSTLRGLFDFVAGVSADAYFLYEDVAFLRRNFESVMNKVIFKFRDADADLVREMCSALGVFYDFLQRKGLASARDVGAFGKVSGGLREKLIHRATRYAVARRDKALGEDQLEAIRDELFGGDHLWPHI